MERVVIQPQPVRPNVKEIEKKAFQRGRNAYIMESEMLKRRRKNRYNIIASMLLIVGVLGMLFIEGKI